MRTIPKTKISYTKTFFTGIFTVLFAFTLVMFPDEAFNASLQGLQIWWEIIFPSLLPFFIVSEILLGFGVVHFIGILLEPLMKPLFNVPGSGAFVLAMGFASGYPMGAKLTTRLREQKMITRVEGERLVSFTTTSDPLFLFGAIAVGFFHDANLGVTLALIHYVSSIIVGITMRFYQQNDNEKINQKINPRTDENMLIKAFKAMHHARIADGRKLGRLMGDAVMSSINTLLMIGGFIILFSVLLGILTKIDLIAFFTQIISLFLIPLGISGELSPSIMYGFFEVTLGAKSVSEASMNLPMIEKIAVFSFISGWSGISVHAQIAAILQKTDIKYFPFLISKIYHAMIAFFITFILWKPLSLGETLKNVPAFLNLLPEPSITFSLWKSVIYLFGFSISLLLLLLFISFFYRILKKWL